MMHESGVEAAELHEFTNLLLRRRHLPVCNGLDLRYRNGNFVNKHNKAKILHLMKAEEALFMT
jgi:hypothetical protein